MKLRTDKYGLFDIKAGQTKRYNLAKVDYNLLNKSYYYHKRYNKLKVGNWQKIGNFVELTGF